MVYSYPINLSNEVLLTDNNLSELSDPPTTNKTVRVYYNGVAIDSIAGPVPLVDLSTEYSTTQGGNPQSVTTKVTLNGKIFRSTYYDPITAPSGHGTKILLEATNKLKDLFKCNNGIFQIKCGDTIIIEGSGVQILSTRFDKSSDNWIFTCDYTVDLEYSEPIAFRSNEPLIKNGSDSWNLDPIDEYVYMESEKANGVTQKSEYHNPKLGISAGPDSRPSPANDIVPGSAGTLLKFITLPRFKISRTISAVGLPGTANTGLCGSGTFSAYHQAKKWVEIQLSKSFQSPQNSGIPTISYNTITNTQSFDKLFLYNHLRNIEFSHLDGSYKVSDTWLAMPTGVTYLEDYTLESSTDNKNLKTVTVAGTIKGLNIASLPLMTGQKGLIPDNSGIINLSEYSHPSEFGQLITAPKKLDSNTVSNNYISSHKYLNAYSGWINDIKPFLYRRACSIINSMDRDRDYVPSIYTPPKPLNNSIYSYERLLNTIPISTSETLDPRKGLISYSYEFSNRFSLFSGVISENVTISNNMPADVVNEAFVIGRRLGPVLQYLGTSTSATKSVTIELVVPPPSSLEGCLLTSNKCPLYIYGPTYNGVKTLVSGLRPFGARQNIFGNMNRAAATGHVQIIKDDDSWNPSEGRFIKNVEWVYQACDLSYNIFKDL